MEITSCLTSVGERVRALFGAGLSGLPAAAAAARQVVVDSLVVVVHSHGKDLLGRLLADHLQLKILVYLKMGRHSRLEASNFRRVLRHQ